jgi:hypothetical protein
MSISSAQQARDLLAGWTATSDTATSPPMTSRRLGRRPTQSG